MHTWQQRSARRRQPKVNDKRATLTIHQDVGRFQIAVDDPMLVRILRSTTYAEKQLQAFLPGQSGVLHIRRQR
jgi:hypothetical protein